MSARTTVGRLGRGAQDTASKRVGFGWFSLLTALYLVVWSAQLTPVQLLLPRQLDTSSAVSRWTDGVILFGLIFAAVGAVALVAAPLLGRLSDRTRGRRRRPFIIGGVLIGAVGLQFLGSQTEPLGVLVGWLVVSLGLVATQAATTALIADQVPPAARGSAGGIVNATQAAGIILGAAVSVLLGLTVPMSYTILSIALAVVGTGVGIMLPDPPVDPSAARVTAARKAGSSPGEADRSDRMWATVAKHRVFRNALIATILLNAGNAMITALLLYFLRFGLGLPMADADDQLLIALLIYTVFAVLAATIGGMISDRLGRRLPIIAVAVALQLIAAVIVLIAPSLLALAVSAALLGVSYGGFGAVNLALMIDVLPNQASAARDLGLAQVAQGAPQTTVPVLGALLIAATGGFSVIFLATALLSIAALLVVNRIRRDLREAV